jgi:hypothetical protein
MDRSDTESSKRYSYLDITLSSIGPAGNTPGGISAAGSSRAARPVVSACEARSKNTCQTGIRRLGSTSAASHIFTFCEIRYIYANITARETRFFAFCWFHMSFGMLGRNQALARHSHIADLLSLANVTLPSFQTVA